MDCRMPGLSVPHYLPGFALSTESVMPSNHLVFCHPLLFLPSMFPSIKWKGSVPESFPMSQLFKWHPVAEVLELRLQHQSLQ